MAEPKIRVMVAGLPRDTAMKLVQAILRQPDMLLVAESLTRRRVAAGTICEGLDLGPHEQMRLVSPANHRVALGRHPGAIVVDVTLLPTVANHSAWLYVRGTGYAGYPFVMATTGGEEQVAIMETVRRSSVSAVIVDMKGLGEPLDRILAAIRFLYRKVQAQPRSYGEVFFQ